MSEIITKYEFLHIVAGLKEETGNFEYQMLFDSLLGISPETVDKNILAERNKEIEFTK